MASSWIGSEETWRDVKVMLRYKQNIYTEAASEPLYVTDVVMIEARPNLDDPIFQLRNKSIIVVSGSCAFPSSPPAMSRADEKGRKRGKGKIQHLSPSRVHN
jgi:hypothetical protein